MEKQYKKIQEVKDKNSIILKDIILWNNGSLEEKIHILNISDDIKIISAQLEIKTLVSHFRTIALKFNESLPKDSQFKDDDETVISNEYDQNLLIGELMLTHYADKDGSEKSLNFIKTKLKKYIVFENSQGEFKKLNDEIFAVMSLDNIFIVLGALINYFL